MQNVDILAYRRFSNVVWTLSTNGFFSGENLLRDEYVIPSHDIDRGCPLRVELSPRKQIIDIGDVFAKIWSLKVQKFPHFWPSVQKCFFFEKISPFLRSIFGGKMTENFFF